MEGIAIFDASSSDGEDVGGMRENERFRDFLELQDLLAYDLRAIDEAVCSAQRDRNWSIDDTVP